MAQHFVCTLKYSYKVLKQVYKWLCTEMDGVKAENTDNCWSWNMGTNKCIHWVILSNFEDGLSFLYLKMLDRYREAIINALRGYSLLADLSIAIMWVGKHNIFNVLKIKQTITPSINLKFYAWGSKNNFRQKKRIKSLLNQFLQVMCLRQRKKSFQV